MLKREADSEFIRRGEENKLLGFTVNGQEVIPLYDPPHLLKGIRNNLLDCDAKFTWLNNQQQVCRASYCNFNCSISLFILI